MYAKSPYRFVLKLARDLLASDPGIKTPELARQLGISVRAAHNYRKAVAASTPDPVDPVQLARRYLERHPRATAREVGAHLGLKRDAGRRYLEAALADIEKRPLTQATYDIPVFLPKKGR